jgi:hypothetical protein
MVEVKHSLHWFTRSAKSNRPLALLDLLLGLLDGVANLRQFDLGFSAISTINNRREGVPPVGQEVWQDRNSSSSAAANGI